MTFFSFLGVRGRTYTIQFLSDDAQHDIISPDASLLFCADEGESKRETSAATEYEDAETLDFTSFVNQVSLNLVH